MASPYVPAKIDKTKTWFRVIGYRDDIYKHSDNVLKLHKYLSNPILLKNKSAEEITILEKMLESMETVLDGGVAEMHHKIEKLINDNDYVININLRNLPYASYTCMSENRITAHLFRDGITISEINFLDDTKVEIDSETKDLDTYKCNKFAMMPPKPITIEFIKELFHAMILKETLEFRNIADLLDYFDVTVYVRLNKHNIPEVITQITDKTKYKNQIYSDVFDYDSVYKLLCFLDYVLDLFMNPIHKDDFKRIKQSDKLDLEYKVKYIDGKHQLVYDENRKDYDAYYTAYLVEDLSKDFIKEKIDSGTAKRYFDD